MADNKNKTLASTQAGPSGPVSEAEMLLGLRAVARLTTWLASNSQNWRQSPGVIIAKISRDLGSGSPELEESIQSELYAVYEDIFAGTGFGFFELSQPVEVKNKTSKTVKEAISHPEPVKPVQLPVEALKPAEKPQLRAVPKPGKDGPVKRSRASKKPVSSQGQLFLVESPVSYEHE